MPGQGPDPSQPSVEPDVGLEKGSRAYRITISCKEDVTPECQQKFLKWVDRYTTMAYVVSELGAGRRVHLHALVFFEVRRPKCSLHNYLWQKIVKPYHPTSIQKYAILINTATDMGWYTDYLRKEEEVEVLIDKMDMAHASKYLPTLEEQASLAAAHKDVAKGRAFHDHKMWTDMAGHFKAWYIQEGYPTPMSTCVAAWHCLAYLNHEMLHGRMVVMVDPRRRQEKAQWLWRAVAMNSQPTPGERQALDRWEHGFQPN